MPLPSNRTGNLISTAEAVRMVADSMAKHGYPFSVDALRDAAQMLDDARDLLTTMDRRGGLGLDRHEQIKALLDRMN